MELEKAKEVHEAQAAEIQEKKDLEDNLNKVKMQQKDKAKEEDEDAD